MSTETSLEIKHLPLKMGSLLRLIWTPTIWYKSVLVQNFINKVFFLVQNFQNLLSVLVQNFKIQVIFGAI